MKATFDIPDDLYRRAKARSALEGRPLRAVVMALFQDWLSEGEKPSPAAPKKKPGTRFDDAPWVAIARRSLKTNVSHEMEEIRASIERGRQKESQR